MAEDGSYKRNASIGSNVNLGDFLGVLDDVRSKMLFMFLASQVLGIFVGINLIVLSLAEPGFEEIKVSPLGEDNIMNALLFVGYVLFASLIFLLILKFYKGRFLFKTIEFFVIFFASNIVFFVLLYFMMRSSSAMILSVLLAFTLAATKMYKPGLRNTAAIISAAGVGAVFGFSLNFVPSLVFAVLLSVYDYIAVFKTRHMITFAKEFSSKDLSFSFVAKKKISIKPSDKYKNVRDRGPSKRKGPSKRRKEHVELGTGDVVVPLMVAVSAFYPFGIIGTVLVAFASIVSLWMLIDYVTRKKVILPALPFIVAGILVAVAFLYIINAISGFSV